MCARMQRDLHTSFIILILFIVKRNQNLKRTAKHRRRYHISVSHCYDRVISKM